MFILFLVFYLIPARAFSPESAFYPEVSQTLNGAAIAYQDGDDEKARMLLQAAEFLLAESGEKRNKQAFARFPESFDALRFSNELAKKAGELTRGAHDEITLRHALSLAEQAIVLNQYNEAALLAKDRVLTLLGSRLASSLPPEDEALFERAVSALRRGNVLEAKLLSERLFRTQANRGIYRVVALKERLDSLL